MKAYELLLLLNPSLDEEARAAVLDKVQGVITADEGVVDASTRGASASSPTRSTR